MIKFFQESTKKNEDDSVEEEKKKRMADENWQRLEKENKPAALAPVFKGAALERKKGQSSQKLYIQNVNSKPLQTS